MEYIGAGTRLRLNLIDIFVGRAIGKIRPGGKVGANDGGEIPRPVVKPVDVEEVMQRTGRIEGPGVAALHVDVPTGKEVSANLADTRGAVAQDIAVRIHPQHDEDALKAVDAAHPGQIGLRSNHISQAVQGVEEWTGQVVMLAGEPDQIVAPGRLEIEHRRRSSDHHIHLVPDAVIDVSFAFDIVGSVFNLQRVVAGD